METKRCLAYIPEQVNRYGNLSGVENLEYFSALAGRDYGRAELLGFLCAAGLSEDAADKRVGHYSKGMRQKVGIAIALAKKANAEDFNVPEGHTKHPFRRGCGGPPESTGRGIREEIRQRTQEAPLAPGRREDRA